MRTGGYSRVTTEDDEQPAAVGHQEELEEQERLQTEEGAGFSHLGILHPLLSWSSLRSQQSPGLAGHLLFNWARPIIDASPTDMDEHVADELTVALPVSLSSARQAEMLQQRRCAIRTTGEEETPETRLIHSLQRS